MFIDETEITVSSGRGGDGIVSFRREKFVPRGGPDGGDGGRGGDVVLRSSIHLNTLAGLQHRRQYRAGNGQPGGANNRTGRDGESLLIEVPVGTLVRDRERGHVLRDLSAAGVEFVVVAGGRGGKGNKHFAHSTNQTPRRATQGQAGQVRELRLELRLVADVGLVGLPNAGKSTFLSRVSAARPKVANYPFTTLEPLLGIVHRDQLGMVIADIPGLIEGAHEGAGLGDRFLRHVARTRVLLQLVDGSEGADAAIAAYRTVRSELALSGLELEAKPVVVALSRSDTVEDPRAIARELQAASGVPVVVLSAHSGVGVAEVLGLLARLLEDVPRPALEPREALEHSEANAEAEAGAEAASPATEVPVAPAEERVAEVPTPAHSRSVAPTSAVAILAEPAPRARPKGKGGSARGKARKAGAKATAKGSTRKTARKNARKGAQSGTRKNLKNSAKVSAIGGARTGAKAGGKAAAKSGRKRTVKSKAGAPPAGRAAAKPGGARAAKRVRGRRG